MSGIFCNNISKLSPFQLFYFILLICRSCPSVPIFCSNLILVHSFLFLWFASKYCLQFGWLKVSWKKKIDDLDYHHHWLKTLSHEERFQPSVIFVQVSFNTLIIIVLNKSTKFDSFAVFFFLPFVLFIIYLCQCQRISATLGAGKSLALISVGQYTGNGSFSSVHFSNH